MILNMVFLYTSSITQIKLIIIMDQEKQTCSQNDAMVSQWVKIKITSAL